MFSKKMPLGVFFLVFFLFTLFAGYATKFSLTDSASYLYFALMAFLWLILGAALVIRGHAIHGRYTPPPQAMVTALFKVDTVGSIARHKFFGWLLICAAWAFGSYIYWKGGVLNYYSLVGSLAFAAFYFVLTLTVDYHKHIPKPRV